MGPTWVDPHSWRSDGPSAKIKLIFVYPTMYIYFLIKHCIVYFFTCKINIDNTDKIFPSYVSCKKFSLFWLLKGEKNLKVSRRNHFTYVWIIPMLNITKILYSAVSNKKFHNYWANENDLYYRKVMHQFQAQFFWVKCGKKEILICVYVHAHAYVCMVNRNDHIK